MNLPFYTWAGQILHPSKVAVFDTPAGGAGREVLVQTQITVLNTISKH